jgi:uncharacterized membrane protein
MHEHKHIQWLLDQLPALVRERVIPSETAASIDGHYRSVLSARPQQNRISLALAVISAVLIGGGIILLFAHNWSRFSRPIRAVLSFLPLLAAQALTVYAFLNKSGNRSWHEAAAIVHTLMIGACLALIGQTYHVPSSGSSLMLTWILLTLPLSWLMHSISVHVLLHFGTVTWFFQAPDSTGRNLTCIALALILTPSVIRIRRLPLPCAGNRLTRWSAALALLIIVPNMLIRDIGSTILVCFSLLLSVYTLLENPRIPERETFFDRPFAILGNTGIFIVLLLCTIPGIWTEFVLQRESLNNLLIIFSLMAIAAGLLIIRHHQLNPARWIVGLTGPLTFFAALLAVKGSFKMVFYWFFCAWLAALGIALLTAGFNEQRLSLVNLGLSVLLIHIFVQFMRADIGYLARSLVFIVLGMLFLGFNRHLSRRWRLSS